MHPVHKLPRDAIDYNYVPVHTAVPDILRYRFTFG